MMTLTPSISRQNAAALLWHAAFLAIAMVFMDVDTIMPAMLVDAGGSAMQLGVLTAIMMGGSSATQLIYAPFISNYSYKKVFLLSGINARIFALLGLGIMLFFSSALASATIIWMIFLLMAVFSFGGAFANVSYTDILGKSILPESRKSFFSTKQLITGTLLFVAALIARKVLNVSEYPLNYGIMFLVASVSLALASVGFWRLKEVVPSRLPVKSPTHFFKFVRYEWQQNSKLKYFLGFVNTMGTSISLLPFIILYAKNTFHIQSAVIGSLLFYKILGSVAMGFVLFFMAGKYRYRYLLYGGAIMALSLPVLTMLSSGTWTFILIFLIGGLIITTYSISMNGVLLEISANENRALYTGITGAGNMIPALFPLLGGWIINSFGFQHFFILFMAVILLSFYFIHKIRCSK